MAVYSIEQIKSWFKTGLYPTESQFWGWMDSYWHKDELIPMSSVDGLPDSLNSKFNAADAQALEQEVSAATAQVGQLSSWVSTLSEEMGDLEDRVTALEEGSGGSTGGAKYYDYIISKSEDWLAIPSTATSVFVEKGSYGVEVPNGIFTIPSNVKLIRAALGTSFGVWGDIYNYGGIRHSGCRFENITFSMNAVTEDSDTSYKIGINVSDQGEFYRCNFAGRAGDEGSTGEGGAIIGGTLMAGQSILFDECTFGGQALNGDDSQVYLMNCIVNGSMRIRNSKMSFFGLFSPPVYLSGSGKLILDDVEMNLAANESKELYISVAEIDIRALDYTGRNTNEFGNIYIGSTAGIVQDVILRNGDSETSSFVGAGSSRLLVRNIRVGVDSYFQNFRNMERCQAGGYSSCYSSPDTTQAATNTVAGGWNQTLE